jgi:iron complex outermembrane receptor protein
LRNETACQARRAHGSRHAPFGVERGSAPSVEANGPAHDARSPAAQGGISMTNLFESRRLRLLGSAAALALALGLGSPALAQSEDPADTTDDATAADEPAAGDEEIVVTGFRAALENAVVEKKTTDLIIESISAEDIGKLPDASIAESIARLPGLTSQRLSGRSQVISIRGFAPDFSTTLLNGREQVSTGDNRAVEFDQYPSEVINQVNIYKTPMGSLVGAGLSGTVDLRTIRPLSFGRQVISVGARGEYADLGKLNADSKDKGWRVNATYVDQFANDTIGVALAASYISSPYQVEEFEAWGYAGVDADTVVIGGMKPFATSTELTRLGLMGTVEFQPTPDFTMTIDGFYSDFKDEQIKRGVEFPLFWSGAQLQPGFTETNGVITEGTFTNVEAVVNNHINQKEAKLYSFGWNGEWDAGTGWSVMGDISYSATDRHELILETNSGTGRGGGVGAVDTVDFVTSEEGTFLFPTLDYSDPSLILLTSPLGWGGTQINPNGPDIRGGQDGYYNDRIIDDELWQFRADVEREFGGGFLKSIQVGANYTVRDKKLTPDEYFLGLAANTDGTVSVPVPSQYLVDPADLGFVGIGPVIAYDPLALLEAGIYNRVPNLYQDVVTKGWEISEDIITAYAQANIESELGWATLTGNAGVQVIWTDQQSEGFASSYQGSNPDGSPIILTGPISGGAKYTDVLPSLNLSLRFPSDFVVRLAASRQMIRPRLDELAVATQFNFDFVQLQYSGNGGNAELRPWRANAIDLTFEKYFGNRGYVAAQFFYKDLKTYIVRADVPFDFTGFPVPGGVDPADVNFQSFVNQPINGDGGTIKGVEVAGTLPFEVFAPALEGFGVTGGVSYTDTDLKPIAGAPELTEIPGYSKWVANGTAYFERWGFSARGSVRHRSSFVGELSGFGAVRTRRRALAETIIDAQIGYEFQPGSSLEGLSVFLQGQNLTDEPFVTINPDQPLQVINHQRYGRRFLAGFNFRF